MDTHTIRRLIGSNWDCAQHRRTPIECHGVESFKAFPLLDPRQIVLVQIHLTFTRSSFWVLVHANAHSQLKLLMWIIHVALVQRLGERSVPVGKANEEFVGSPRASDANRDRAWPMFTVWTFNYLGYVVVASAFMDPPHQLPLLCWGYWGTPIWRDRISDDILSTASYWDRLLWVHLAHSKVNPLRNKVLAVHFIYIPSCKTQCLVNLRAYFGLLQLQLNDFMEVNLPKNKVVVEHTCYYCC